MTITINGTELDVDAIEREIQYHPAKDIDTARREATNALVIRTLLLQQARAEGLAQDDDMAIEALLEQHIGVDEPDEKQCLSCYEASRDQYRAPDLFEASHILLPALPDDDEKLQDSKAKAEDCIAKLQDKPDRFSALAAEFSACSSAQNGGTLGQFSAGETVDEFETFLYNLEPGQLCPVPVHTRFGFHVLRLDHYEAGRELPFEAVRDDVRDDLLSVQWQISAKNYVGELIKSADISGIDMSANP